MELIIGLAETVGDHTGENKVISELSEELTTWELKPNAHGLHHSTPGVLKKRLNNQSQFRKTQVSSRCKKDVRLIQLSRVKKSPHHFHTNI